VGINTADALNSGMCRGHKFVNRYSKNEVSSCTKCSEYESQLREALDELSSLKLVNKLLQKEVLTYMTRKNLWVTDRDRIDDNGWTLVNDKSRTWAKDRSVKLNQPIQTTNRYTPLDNMFISNEDTTEMLVNGVKKMTKSASLRKTMGNGTVRKKTKKKKFIVVGDSHARGLAAERSESLEKSFEVMGTIMPGSGLSHIIGLASREISQLQRTTL